MVSTEVEADPSTATEPAPLAELRRRASESFAALPHPVMKDKGWEHTDPESFGIDSYEASKDGVEALASLNSEGLPDGVIVMPLAEAAAQHADLVAPYLGSLVLDGDKFAAQNSAEWQAGVFIHVPANTRVEQPISLETTQKTAAGALFWRLLIVVGDGAEATVSERYLSSQDDLNAYFNPVAEIFVGAGAKLNFLASQELSIETLILGSQRARVERDGDLHWVVLGLGSGNGKLRMETDLRGRGANGRVTGAYMSRDSQHLDFDTTQEHFAPDTTSDLAFRGILLDRATAVWRGMIRVEPDAQRTDAFQENRNLLLSPTAHADAIPGLEIEANDVRCTHAATLGRVDENQVFYLMSRGLTRAAAEHLLVTGFLEVVAARLDGSQFVHDAFASTLEKQLQRLGYARSAQ